MERRKDDGDLATVGDDNLEQLIMVLLKVRVRACACVCARCALCARENGDARPRSRRARRCMIKFEMKKRLKVLWRVVICSKPRGLTVQAQVCAGGKSTETV